MTEEICFQDATALAAALRARTLSPVEVLRAHEQRISELNPKLNAFVTLNMDAMAEAKAAEVRLARGQPRGPLDGVPVSIKDCFDVAGMVCARGSELFRDRVPAADASAVARLRAAGAVFLGKTNLPEFALWWETDNKPFGRTYNPWNVARIAGGSSGGEAAALAAGMSALGLGSDVAASIRLPAGLCGVFGLKPSHGRVPLTGHWPDTLLRFMHAGPMARSVRDLALGLAILDGPDGLDPEARPLAPFRAAELRADVRGFRVGLSEHAGADPIEPAIVAAVQAAAGALADAGAVVEPFRTPALDARDWQVLTLAIWGAEGGAFLAPLLAGREGELSENIRRRSKLAPASFDEYLAALAACDSLRAEVAAAMRRFDLILCPLTPLPAPPHDLREYQVAGKSVPARHMVRATVPWNITGQPALAVPWRLSADGLPIAVQVVGRLGDDVAVLRAGLVLEAAAPMRGKRPPL